MTEVSWVHVDPEGTNLVGQGAVPWQAHQTVQSVLTRAGVKPSDCAWGVGIWGRKCDMDCEVKPGDRVEVYAPLRLDPKEARRVRAQRREEQA